MRVLLTPVGPRDKVIEWIPRNCGLIPETAHVTVAMCFDTYGRDVDVPYQTRLLTKLCTRANSVVKSVTCVQISWFENFDDFKDKLDNADVFFMSGFTGSSPIIERIFCRTDFSMTLKRHAVSNRICRNLMAYWGVCGSAIASGCSWDKGAAKISSRTLPAQNFQMLEILADGYVDYQSSAGAEGIQVTSDMTEWHITSGTGCVIVATPERRHGQAFVCVKNNYTAYNARCTALTGKLQSQIGRLYHCVSYYRSGLAANSSLWRLFWGSGKIESTSQAQYEADRRIVVDVSVDAHVLA